MLLNTLQISIDFLSLFALPPIQYWIRKNSVFLDSTLHYLMLDEYFLWTNQNYSWREWGEGNWKLKIIHCHYKRYEVNLMDKSYVIVRINWKKRGLYVWNCFWFHGVLYGVSAMKPRVNYVFQSDINMKTATCFHIYDHLPYFDSRMMT